jgi:hypothetical protein
MVQADDHTESQEDRCNKLNFFLKVSINDHSGSYDPVNEGYLVTTAKQCNAAGLPIVPAILRTQGEVKKKGGQGKNIYGRKELGWLPQTHIGNRCCQGWGDPYERDASPRKSARLLSFVWQCPLVPHSTCSLMCLWP